MEESKQNETFYCHNKFKCCTEKQSSIVTYLFFSAYFIPVYVSFIIVKNCGFIYLFIYCFIRLNIHIYS